MRLPAKSWLLQYSGKYYPLCGVCAQSRISHKKPRPGRTGLQSHKHHFVSVLEIDQVDQLGVVDKGITISLG